VPASNWATGDGPAPRERGDELPPERVEVEAGVRRRRRRGSSAASRGPEHLGAVTVAAHVPEQGDVPRQVPDPVAGHRDHVGSSAGRPPAALGVGRLSAMVAPSPRGRRTPGVMLASSESLRTVRRQDVAARAPRPAHTRLGTPPGRPHEPGEVSSESDRRSRRRSASGLSRDRC